MKILLIEEDMFLRWQNRIKLVMAMIPNGRMRKPNVVGIKQLSEMLRDIVRYSKR